MNTESFQDAACISHNILPGQAQEETGLKHSSTVVENKQSGFAGMWSTRTQILCRNIGLLTVVTI